MSGPPLRAAIAALDPLYRQVLLLHAREWLDYAAIARRLGIDTATVEQCLAEAMLALQRFLAEAEL